MKRGDLVICVNSDFCKEQLLLTPEVPQKENYYIVRDILESTAMDGRLCVLLEEIHNKVKIVEIEGVTYRAEAGFSILRFKVAMRSEQAKVVLKEVNELL